MSLDETLQESIQPFFDRGLITEVLQELKSGKEATVYACRGGPRLGGKPVAVKVYRPLEHRHFRNDAAYRAGRPVLNARTGRAIASRTEFGKQAAFGMWVNNEWEYLHELYDLGIDVPRPLDRTDHALAMTFIGDHRGEEVFPAPQLRAVRLTGHESYKLWDRMLWNIKQMLRHHRIHGDLSPYNILWHGGKGWIIDVPQVVDPRENPNAREMFTRDLENVWRYCSKQASDLPDPWKLADFLWYRWKEGKL